MTIALSWLIWSGVILIITMIISTLCAIVAAFRDRGENR